MVNKVKILTVLVLLGMIMNLNGQETKLISEKIKEQNEIEEYYVDRANKDIKHGEYKLTWNWKFYKALKVKGQYDNNLKVGTWVYYFDYAKGKYGKDLGVQHIVIYEKDKPNGKYLQLDYHGDTVQIGWLKDNKRVGEWKIFKKLQLIEHYDFSNRESKIDRQGEYEIEISPRLQNDFDIIRYLKNNLELSYDKEQSSMSGMIGLEFVISADSSVTSVDVLESNNKTVSEAFKSCLSKSKWEPAIKNGENISCKMNAFFSYYLVWEGNGKNRRFRINLVSDSLVLITNNNR